MALQLTVQAMPFGVETTVPPVLVLTTSFVIAETTVPLTGGTTTTGTPLGVATTFGAVGTSGTDADPVAEPSGTATGLGLLEDAALLLLVVAAVLPPPPQPPSNNAEINNVARLSRSGRAVFSQEDPARGRTSSNVRVTIGVFMFFVLPYSQNSLTADAANNEECMRVCEIKFGGTLAAHVRDATRTSTISSGGAGSRKTCFMSNYCFATTQV
ncbi:hypothetical protein [Actimicrobium sp. GrIS 1.19]|uniref:hypothetical protein n=1 Tax=Actimicrobium sp. GrIS 1.19 TaxID=3071708 RepID=UPI002E163407